MNNEMSADAISAPVICIDAAEARLLRKLGYRCVTSAKIRAQIRRMMQSGADNALSSALEAIGRFGGMSNADNPDHWPMWKFARIRGAEKLRAALSALPIVPTPLRDPKNVCETAPGAFWPCSGTTVLVAKDTFALVRVADSYAGFSCYRPSGRMDDPIVPALGRVCLITKDELRLLRVDGIEDIEVVFCFRPESTEEMTGSGVTPWPTPIRAICGEHPSMPVGIAPYLVSGRHGYPFFLGLSRGMGYETESETCVTGEAAIEYSVQTNRAPETVKLRVVAWEGGDDVRQLVRYGGLSIFQDQGGRRKVQLRSLGLARSQMLAGAAIYELSANYQTLMNWAVTRTFAKPSGRMRERNLRRVRCENKASPENTRGTYIIHIESPLCFKGTLSGSRKSAAKLREMQVGDGGGVTTVRLKTLTDGGTYFLNGRAKEKDGEILIDRKRCMIRCPRWEPKDAGAMLEWLKGQSCVILAGNEDKGRVFAVVRVANGTEDQQAEAVGRWGEAAGRRFAHASGCPSWVPGSLELASPTRILAITYTNWKASALETACFERYRTEGDYSKPLNLKREATRSALERARAYVETVKGLDARGERNIALAGAMLNIRDKFGGESLQHVLGALFERSTLPEREKRRMANRILGKTERQAQNG